MYRGRLAPSPTGALHLGNARTFLVAWLRARQAGGSLLLRVEDIDGPRVKAGAAAASLADLRWLGLDWDEGPDLGGPHAPYVQTERRERYAAALERLRAAGRVYPCVCSRKEVEEASSAPHGPEGARYPGTCRERPAAELQGRKAAWRFRAPEGATAFRDGFAGEQVFDVTAETGDFVVAKSPQPGGGGGGGGGGFLLPRSELTGDPAYQLAVVVDDAAMGVTEVVRGDDLLPSTARQILLYEALGAADRTPAFLHVPLVVGPDGKRLAKRHGDTTIAAYRRAGWTAERIGGLLAGWLGIEGAGEVLPRDLLGRFDLARVPRGPIVYDPAAR